MNWDSSLIGGLIAGLATLATGGIAIWVFYLQKKSEKINAAISLLFEIRNAESKIDIISEKLNANNVIDLPTVLPTNNWQKYSHLFAKDFDEDELKLMNTFYSSCGIIEDLVNKQNNFIWIAAEERGKIVQKLLADIHMEFQVDIIENPSNRVMAQAKFDNRKLAITKYYADESYSYAPQKTIGGLKFQLDNLQKIMTTTCGAKLKAITQG